MPLVVGLVDLVPPVADVEVTVFVSVEELHSSVEKHSQGFALSVRAPSLPSGA